jgi:hypothetical protein
MASRKKLYIDFRNYAPVTCAQTGGAAAGTDNTVTNCQVGPYTLEVRNEQLNGDITFTRNAAGWVIPNDNTDNDGVEIGFGVAETTTNNGQSVFTIGTDPAFKLSVKFTIPDVSDYDVCAIGFRKAAAYGDAPNAPTIFSSAVLYTDAAGFNVNAGDIYTFTGKNQTGGGTGTYTATDTTDNWADGESHTLTVLVSASGVVTFQIDGAAPTVNTNTLTFDSGDEIIPFILMTKGAAASDTPPILTTLYCGLQ